MTRARQGLTVIILVLAAVAPLHAVQDSASRPGSGHHDGGGGKHGGGSRWLSYNAASNTVTFKLVAGRARGANRLNFNGYTDGKATLVVPAKSSVVIKFVNKDSIPHSAVIIGDGEPMPVSVTHPALPQAGTKDLTQGLPPHGTDLVRFTAPASGSYRIVSGVPGQARAGMWIRFRVDPTAKTPAWRKGV